jgi:hypothetical protein
MLTPIVLLAGCSVAWAQGNDSTSVSARSDEPAANAVQIGAGSTSAVTTGSSGPQPESTPGERGTPAPFEIRPASRAFVGPAPLPISRPDRLLCDRIDDENARRLCETRAAERAKGGRDG